MWMFFLAQADAAATTSGTTAVAMRPWWQVLLDNGLALTILFIFLSAIVGVLLNGRRRDKCLKLFNDFHVSYLTAAGKSLWGDLTVYSQGIELRFDAPHVTRRGLVKTSALIYPDELANCLAICRAEGALPPDEVRKRRRQIRRSFRPGILRRTFRWMRNLLSTLRDAFSKAFSALIGALIRSRPGTAIASQQGQVDQIGQTVLGAAGNAYEPMLEAHIGKPVILRLVRKTEQREFVLELPGYLVDYTQHYVAVFNVEHGSGQVFEHRLDQNLTAEGYEVVIDGKDVRITCTGHDPLIIDEFDGGDGQVRQLCLPLVPGTTAALRRKRDQPATMRLRITRQIDIVCPRKLAVIHFGSGDPVPLRSNWRGLAPENEAEGSDSAVEQTAER